jgi:galactitol-specific phosphotransferase system IIB component
LQKKFDLEARAIVTDKYFQVDEIQEHLKNVEYIIMATPAPEHFKDTPIEFTIFLNTKDKFPQEIKDAILDKFLDENGIKNPIEVMSQLMPVGFSMSLQETPMPLLLVKQEDQASIPYEVMHVINFLADSDNFFEAKDEKLTGWSYSYNSK